MIEGENEKEIERHAYALAESISEELS